MTCLLFQRQDWCRTIATTADDRVGTSADPTVSSSCASAPRRAA